MKTVTATAKKGGDQNKNCSLLPNGASEKQSHMSEKKYKEKKRGKRVGRTV